MAGERSIYRKLQVVLEYAKSSRYESLSQLAKHVEGRAPTNFAYYYRDRKTDKVVKETSSRSIDATISLAVELGLLSDGTASPSKTGSAATDPRRFPQIIANRTEALLEKKGVSLGAIRGAISRNLLQSEPPRLPTADAIWSSLPGVEIDLKEFARLLRILADAGAISSSQKRVYFLSSLPKVNA